MPIPETYVDVIKSLLTATRDRRVHWTQSTPKTAKVVLPDFSIELWGGRDVENDRDFVAFAMKDKVAQPIDNWSCDSDDADFNILFELYTEALRVARGVNDRLNRLRAILGDKSQEVGAMVEDLI